MARKKLSTFNLIIAGFIGLILLGSLLLMLPFASTGEGCASFADTLFTATSAGCVTGLVVQDTGTYWTFFGQVVILLLIQVGGLGVITVTTLFAIVSGRHIGLMERSTLQDSISALSLGNILKLAVFMLRITLIAEGMGAVLLFPVFYQEFGLWQGLWYSIFHSVSAFCNAGFDLMGVKERFSSLTSYAGNGWVNFVIMGLIVQGGIGFLTIDDILTHKHHIRHYRMQSKAILLTTAILIFVPALVLFFSEFTTEPVGRRICMSLFQSVTMRTAGFNTANLARLSHATLAMMLLLMTVGGSPGSTAGGIKTTTLAVLVACMAATFRRRRDVTMFRRRIDPMNVRNAASLFLLYIILIISASILLCQVDHVTMAQGLFETASAVGTVGVTLGITTRLSLVSRGALVLLMFIGRVGGLTMIYAHISAKNSVATMPIEKITIG